MCNKSVIPDVHRGGFARKGKGGGEKQNWLTGLPRAWSRTVGAYQGTKEGTKAYANDEILQPFQYLAIPAKSFPKGELFAYGFAESYSPFPAQGGQAPESANERSLASAQGGQAAMTGCGHTLPLARLGECVVVKLTHL